MKSLKLELAAPIIFLTVLALLFLISWIEPKIEHIDQNFLKANIGKHGVVVVDVREEEIFNGKSPGMGLPGGHIKGAVNFPFEDLKIKAAAALARTGLTKRASIILYCNTGHLSEVFGEALIRDFGFYAPNIKTYEGGIKDWVRNPENKLYPEEHETGNETENF